MRRGSGVGLRHCVVILPYLWSCLAATNEAVHIVSTDWSSKVTEVLPELSSFPLEGGQKRIPFVLINSTENSPRLDIRDVSPRCVDETLEHLPKRVHRQRRITQGDSEVNLRRWCVELYVYPVIGSPKDEVSIVAW